MKNPSIAAAAVLVVLSVVVGVLALSSGEDSTTGDASVLTAVAETPKASFETLSPHELRMKARLEETRRELEKVKKIGKEVAPGTFKVVDDNGEVTFYKGDLLPGFGRGGQPLYLTAQFKRIPNVPKVARKKIPEELVPKLKTEKMDILRIDQPKSETGPNAGGGPKGDGGAGGADNQGGSGQAGGGSDAGGGGTKAGGGPKGH